MLAVLSPVLAAAEAGTGAAQHTMSADTIVADVMNFHFRLNTGDYGIQSMTVTKVGREKTK